MANISRMNHLLEYYKVLGKKVRKIRNDFGLTQEAMGKIIGYSRKHISSVENGHRRATMDFLISIEDNFQVKMENILEGAPTQFKMLLEMDVDRTMMEELSPETYEFVRCAIKMGWKNDHPGEDYDKRRKEIEKSKQELIS